MRAKRRREEHPDRERAMDAVYRALKTGVLVKLPCLECGKPAEAHHADYADWLSVVWLCRSHHRAVHAMHRRMVSRENKGQV